MLRSITYIGMCWMLRHRSALGHAAPKGVGRRLGAVRAPVLRRMPRTWFAAVCSLMNSAVPISRFERPRATSRRTSSSRAERPSGSGELDTGASARARASSVGHPDSSRRGARPRRAALRAIGVSVERAACAAVLVGGMGEPRVAPICLLRCSAASKWLGRAVGVAKRRGEHSEIAVGGAVAGDAVTDHDVPAGQWGQLG